MEIVTRSAWGANPASRGPAVQQPNLDAVLHHTVTTPTGDPAADARTVERIGMDRFGRMSYQWLIHPSGVVLEGQGDRIGAHLANRNSTTVGVALIGNYQVHPVTGPMVGATVQLLAWLASRNRIRTATFAAGGHRDYGSTACPGDHGYKLVPDPHKLIEEDEMLQRGDEGTAVRWFQVLLNNWQKDVAGTPDGKFGPTTESAVKAYQKFADLEQTGKIGAITAATLARYSTMYRRDLRDALEW